MVLAKRSCSYLALDNGAGTVLDGKRLPDLERLLQAEEMRRFCGSTSSTTTSFPAIVGSRCILLGQDISETWISPSMPGSTQQNAP